MFITRMQIQDNIIIAHEVYNYLNLKKEGKKFEVALKIDMNKAYDRLEWDFLEAIIKRMGFAELRIKLSMACQFSSFSGAQTRRPHFSLFILNCK